MGCLWRARCLTRPLLMACMGAVIALGKSSADRSREARISRRRRKQTDKLSRFYSWLSEHVAVTRSRTDTSRCACRPYRIHRTVRVLHNASESTPTWTPSFRTSTSSGKSGSECHCPEHSARVRPSSPAEQVVPVSDFGTPGAGRGCRLECPNVTGQHNTTSTGPCTRTLNSGTSLERPRNRPSQRATPAFAAHAHRRHNAYSSAACLSEHSAFEKAPTYPHLNTYIHGSTVLKESMFPGARRLGVSLRYGRATFCAYCQSMEMFMPPSLKSIRPYL